MCQLRGLEYYGRASSIMKFAPAGMVSFMDTGPACLFSVAIVLKSEIYKKVVVKNQLTEDVVISNQSLKSSLSSVPGGSIMHSLSSVKAQKRACASVLSLKDMSIFVDVLLLKDAHRARIG